MMCLPVVCNHAACCALENVKMYPKKKDMSMISYIRDVLPRR